VEPTLQGIFREAFPAYAETHPLPLHKHKAAAAIIECRTDALGGHVDRCECGHIEGVWYNSCKNRNCPQCCGLPNERWLEEQKARLLDCDHYHAIFTLPHELLGLWRLNTRLMTDLLFRSARDTLMELLRDPRYLGAIPGILIALHTWGRSQSLHPHLHCLITGGGLTDDGEWKPVTNGFLLPFRLVAFEFRKRLIEGLRKAHAAGDLRLPDELTPQRLINLCNQLQYKTKWVVHLCERYPHGEGVAAYLARYLKGGPIDNRQILQADEEHVTFRYKDHRDRHTKTLTLPTDRFVQRFLWHIPEPGMHGVRHYGLYAHQKRAARETCRPLLGQSPREEKPAFLDWQTWLQRLGCKRLTECPVCGRPVRTVEILPKRIIPPPIPPPAIAEAA
jgi:hypothetical protein